MTSSFIWVISCTSYSKPTKWALNFSWSINIGKSLGKSFVEDYIVSILMHIMSQNCQRRFKNLAANAGWILKCDWPFEDIMN